MDSFLKAFLVLMKLLRPSEILCSKT